MSTASTTIRSFSALIGTAEDGILSNDLNNELISLVKGLRDHAATTNGKAEGKLSLVMNFKVDGEIVELRADIKTTLPKSVRSKSVLWSTIDGHLNRANPKQPDMFRDVSANTPEVRNV